MPTPESASATVTAAQASHLLSEDLDPIDFETFLGLFALHFDHAEVIMTEWQKGQEPVRTAAVDAVCRRLCVGFVLRLVPTHHSLLHGRPLPSGGAQRNQTSRLARSVAFEQALLHGMLSALQLQKAMRVLSSKTISWIPSMPSPPAPATGRRGLCLRRRHPTS
jgi:hypothetical protein